MDRAPRQFVRCIVSGRVQGVFYRKSAQQRAQSLGVTGRAINLPDGRVQVDAWGEEAALAVFVAWLQVGPALARVSEVDVVASGPAPETEASPAHFTTG